MYIPLNPEVPLDKERKNGGTILDLFESNELRPDERTYLGELRRIVGAAVYRLDEREQRIIRERFGLSGGTEYTLEEIGKHLNLSRERVRQLEREAKNKLRDHLEFLYRSSTHF